MKNNRFYRLVVIALATTLYGVFLATRYSPAHAAPPAGSNDSQFGTTLLYEIVAEKDKVDPATIDNAVRVLGFRVNTTWSPAARIRRTASGQIEIGIYSHDTEKARHIQDLIERRGILEFRILANSHDHQKLIERARGEPKKNELKNEKGAVLARWVLVRPKEAEQLKHDADIATRQTASGGMEVLVVHDRFNINGSHFKEVAAGTNKEMLTPEVLFTFNSEGGELFGKFTSENLPNADGSKRHLGIIVDDCVWTAPGINSRVTDSGRITGDFKKEEVDDIVTVLRSGGLPCKIKLVSKVEHAEAKK